MARGVLVPNAGVALVELDSGASPQGVVERFQDERRARASTRYTCHLGPQARPHPERGPLRHQMTCIDDISQRGMLGERITRAGMRGVALLPALSLKHLMVSTGRKRAASTTPCCSASRPSPTCSRPGSSCCSAPPFAPTASSGCCRRTPLPNMLGSMIRLSRPAPARCSTETLSGRCRPQLLRQLTCHSVTEWPAPAGAPAACWASWQDSFPGTACTPSDRNRAAPRQFELTARRHAPCPRSGMLTRLRQGVTQRGRANRLAKRAAKIGIVGRQCRACHLRFAAVSCSVRSSYRSPPLREKFSGGSHSRQLPAADWVTSPSPTLPCSPDFPPVSTRGICEHACVAEAIQSECASSAWVGSFFFQCNRSCGLRRASGSV